MMSFVVWSSVDQVCTSVRSAESSIANEPTAPKIAPPHRHTSGFPRVLTPRDTATGFEMAVASTKDILANRQLA